VIFIKTYSYQTKGTCSRQIEIELDGDTIQSVKFRGGCAGNTAGIEKIVSGMKAQDVIKKFSGIQCGNRPTSCPDQLAIALTEALEKR
jgi:uncharacterized protein (TIGR03905 family)